MIDCVEFTQQLLAGQQKLGVDNVLSFGKPPATLTILQQIRLYKFLEQVGTMPFPASTSMQRAVKIINLINMRGTMAIGRPLLPNIPYTQGGIQ